MVVGYPVGCLSFGLYVGFFDGLYEGLFVGLYVGRFVGSVVGGRTRPLTFPSDTNEVSSFPKFTEPSPEAGSQPGAAWNPWVQQILSEVHLMLPDVMSFTNDVELAYKTGWTQPRDPLPAAMRAALIFEKNPARVGEDADVPDS